MSKTRIPESWAQCKLGDVAERITKGSTPTSAGHKFQTSGIPFVKVEAIKNNQIDGSLIKDYISPAANNEQERSKLKPGDLLYSIAGTIGQTALVEEDDCPANCNQAIAIIRGTSSIFDPKFLSLQLKSPHISEFSNEKKRGGALQNISLGDISEFPVRVPPFPEQKRIVAKIESTHEKIKVIEDSVTKAEELIEKYREALLQKAFRGELVKQDPNDEPASKLLERIRSERAQASDSKKKKKDDLPPIKPEEIPFVIPKSWEWVRFNFIIEVLKRGPSKAVNKDLKGIRYITSGNIQNGKIVFEDEVKHLKDHEPHQEAIIDENDLIISCVNSKVKLGKSGVFRNAPEKCMVGFNNYAIQFFRGIDVNYMNLICNSTFFKAQVDKYAKDAINQSSFAGKDLDKFLVPLPSFETQKQISAIWQNSELLLENCRSHFADLNAKLTKIHEAILAKAFTGKLIEQFPSEGTGHELLEKIKSQANISVDERATEKKATTPAKKKRAKK